MVVVAKHLGYHKFYTIANSSTSRHCMINSLIIYNLYYIVNNC